MLVTSPNLAFFFTALETRFWTAYSTAPVAHEKICTTYPVGTEQWVSGWMNMLPVVREWKSSRVVNTPGIQDYLVKMQLFETTASVDQFKLADDQTGIYNPLVAMMGMQTKKWPDYQVRDLLQNKNSQTGIAQLGLDGLTHWNTAHPVDFYDSAKGTYCNDYTAGGFVENGITVGGAFGLNSFATVWESMAGRKSESGEALGLVPDCTLHAPQLKLTVDTVLQAQFMAQPAVGGLTGNVGATENVLARGWSDPMMWADLASDPNTWYELCLNKPVKPFSWLLREAPNFVYRIQPDDPVVFDTHTYLYGSMMRGAPAWSFAWLSSRSGP